MKFMALKRRSFWFYSRLLKLFLFSFFVCGCLMAPETRIAQPLEGKVHSIKEIVNLKCRLETGSRTETEIPFTNAETFHLEIKNKDGSYQPAREESVTYSYEEDGTKKTGWINHFGYVTLGTIKRHGKVSPGETLSCDNLLSRYRHPLLRARSGHPYDVRFQVRAGLVRVLIVASAGRSALLRFALFHQTQGQSLCHAHWRLHSNSRR